MSRTIDTFLRSISLRMDLAQPARFAHFRPTGKSAQVTDAIARGVPSAASMVVAAYGSGKSIAAGAGALLVENAPEAAEVIGTLARRLETAEPTAADFARRRRAGRARGAALVLEGALDDPARALHEAAEARLGELAPATGNAATDPVPVLDAIAARAREAGLDRIAIVWDEFGRHLEALAAGGRPEELSVVQQIAEWSVRQDAPAATFTLLLHQSFFHYAGALSQTARNAWRKIEGRFTPIRFVDDSREMHQLIAWVVEQSRPKNLRLPGKATFRAAAARARELGFFTGFEDEAELADTLRRAYPLAPAALHLLPRLAARMAQNERTVFSFLNEADLARPVTLRDLFDGFSEAMRADIGAGGAHRRWLEAQSALSKTDGEVEAEAVAAAALLGLGHAGQRMRLSLAGLLFALDSYGARPEAATRAAVDRLIERKLLLHRERTDDVTVWHGTDLDLRGRLEEEKRRLAPGFDLVAYLSSHHPPEAWKPIEHNLRNDIRRYFRGVYISARELLRDGSEHPLFRPGPGEDGRIIYALPEGPQETAALEELAKRSMPKRPEAGVLLVFPAGGLAITEVALEAACLDSLQHDAELIGKDPFALPEIQHMADAAHENLRRQLARLARPSGEACWYAHRQRLTLTGDADLRRELSRIADARFPLTPRINNEVVVRKALSRPMVNARKKVVLGVLERAGQPHLGFDPAATTPFVSIYRTVLERTGLYREDGGRWRWARPEEVADDGLRAVWQALADFFGTPGEAKNPAELIDKLQSPPHGARFGVVPVLVAAGLKAFGKAVAIRRDGAYLPDVLASDIEEICARPERHSVQVIDLDDALAARLERLTEIFGAEHAGGESDQLRRAWDAVQAWTVQLPPSALRSRQVGPAARAFQRALRESEDPVELFLAEIPNVAGTDRLDDGAVATIDVARRELEGIVAGYQAMAIAAIRETVALSADGADTDALTRAQAWANCIDDETAAQRGLDGTQRALLQQAKQAASGHHTEASFARALSNILIGKDFDQWEDRTPRHFASLLRAAVHQIESAALNAGQPDSSLQPLLETRINHLVGQMRQVAPPHEVARLLDRLREQAETAGQAEEVLHGHPERRAG